MTENHKMPRTVRGKRPQFFDIQGLDEAMSMIMVLAEELAVVHDRLDTVERVAAAKGVILNDEIEAFHFDQDALAARETWRQQFFERMFYLLRQQASEAASGDTAERYAEVLATIAEP
jgi:hypothetical protein